MSFTCFSNLRQKEAFIRSSLKKNWCVQEFDKHIILSSELNRSPVGGFPFPLIFLVSLALLKFHSHVPFGNARNHWRRGHFVISKEHDLLRMHFKGPVGLTTAYRIVFVKFRSIQHKLVHKNLLWNFFALQTILAVQKQIVWRHTFVLGVSWCGIQTWMTHPCVWLTSSLERFFWMTWSCTQFFNVYLRPRFYQIVGFGESQEKWKWLSGPELKPGTCWPRVKSRQSALWS